MGTPNFCTDLRFFGSPPVPGALFEFVAHPVHLVYPLPVSTPFPVWAVIEPLGVAIHAVDLGHLVLGDRAAVFGCGPIGLLIARVARLAGAARVLGTEPLVHRRKAADRFGVDVALDPSTEDARVRMPTHSPLRLKFGLVACRPAFLNALDFFAAAR